MVVFHRVHWCRLSRVQALRSACSGPLVVCSLLLSALSLFYWCVACKYGSISHFEGVFSGFPLLDVCLYCLRALRGLWGFCVREWLGGLKACGVFASLFVLLPFFFCSCVCLLLCWLSFFALVVFCLSSCIVFVALWVWLLFPFPFRTIRKKKGRAVLVRPLFVCRGCSNSCNVIEELRCCCFGSF